MPRARKGRKRYSKYGRLKLQAINKKRDKELEKQAQKQAKKLAKEQKKNNKLLQEHNRSINKEKVNKVTVDTSKVKHISIISVIAVFLIILLCVSAVPAYNAIKNVFASNKDNNDDIYNVENTGKQNNNVNIESGMSLTFLGDIMMTDNLRNSDKDISLAFKEIAFMTSKTDYTIANIAMSITSADTSTYEPLPSKYISDTKILNGLRALGVDVVNLATDHMLDYGDTIFKRTIELLKEANYIPLGINKDTVYLEKNGIKVAVIAQNSTYIGTKSKYEDVGINTYDKEGLNAQIIEAKRNADIVIVSLHYGSETENEITDQMREMAKDAIDGGADMVLGHHAIGLLPIEIYNGKPIIYSIGYIMHDTTTEFAKQSASFDIIINKQKKLSQIVINPVYIAEAKEVSKYTGKSFVSFVADYKNKCKELGTDMEIIDEKMYIKID